MAMLMPSDPLVDDHLGLGGLYCSEREEDRADAEEISGQAKREGTKTTSGLVEQREAFCSESEARSDFAGSRWWND